MMLGHRTYWERERETETERQRQSYHRENEIIIGKIAWGRFILATFPKLEITILTGNFIPLIC